MHSSLTIHPAGGVRAAGFSLIENMVAMVIFVIGILAIGYLIVDGMGLSKTSQGQTGAYVAAQEMAGMLRAAGSGALAYNGVTLSSTNPPTGNATIEQANLRTWWQALTQLPGAAGSATLAGTGQPRLQARIAVVPVNGTLCPCTATITESWGQDSYVVTTAVDY